MGGDTTGFKPMFFATETIIKVSMVELCRRDLHGLGMPAEWNLNTVVQNFNEKDDIMNCS